MGVPIGISRIAFVDKDKNIRNDVAVKVKESGYRPTVEYHPTRKAVRCKECGGVGIAEFLNGFNLKDGDRLMEGKPIRGMCVKCGKETELVPLAPHLKKSEEGIRHLYNVQRALDEYTKRGATIHSGSILLPPEKIKQLEERANDQRIVSA